MQDWALFLDDGGVMNDNTRRGEQWRRLVGEYFAPRLGGSAAAWAAANGAWTDELFAPQNWSARLAASASYEHFEYHYQLDWLMGMCRRVGVHFPAASDSYVLAREAASYVTRRVHATFPGTIEAIRRLRHDGYTLYTASGEPSWELDGYLDGMGVRDCFARLYGPDLVDAFKTGPAYYERIIADAGIEPLRALVIDDSAQAVGWARAAGARAIQVVGSRAAADGEVDVIASVAQLPALLSTIR